jgi:hypothetical protein
MRYQQAQKIHNELRKSVTEAIQYFFTETRRMFNLDTQLMTHESEDGETDRWIESVTKNGVFVTGSWAPEESEPYGLQDCDTNQLIAILEALEKQEGDWQQIEQEEEAKNE